MAQRIPRVNNICTLKGLIKTRYQTRGPHPKLGQPIIQEAKINMIISMKAVRLLISD